MRPPFSLIFLLLLILCGVSRAESGIAAADVLQLSPQAPLSLGMNLEYLIGEPDASFESIAARPASDWQRNSRPTLGLGTQRDGVWVRFAVRNNAYRYGNWQLEIKWPMLDRVELRQFDPQTGLWSNPQVSGDHVPPSQRPLAHRYLLLPVELPSERDSHIYLHVRAAETMILPMQLTSAEQLAASDSKILPLMHMFFGGALVMLLYNASLYIFTRDRSYIFYVLYLTAALGYELAVSGIGHQYIWGEWSWLAPKAYSLFAAGTFLLSLLFARVFLKLVRYGGWILALNNIMIAYWSLLIAAVLVYPPAAQRMLSEVMPIVACIAGFVTTGYLWYRGNISAKLFTIAWSVLITATVVHLLALNGALPLNTFTLGAQMIGVFFEFVMLSIALAERINRERAERVEAQNSLLLSTRNLAHEREEKLRAQQQILDLQRAANEELETRVRERTLDLENAKQELELANRELAALSITDPLTKLHNRRHFDSVIAEEVARSKRTGSPLSVLMLDIDHFKRVNDTYGHPFGDECLRQVADAIQKHAQRAGDLAARYGGEEFILALPATDIEHAALVAENIRLAVEALHLEHEGERVPLTMSVGVASLVFAREDDIASLVGSADAALYRAKRNGRNQIATHA